MGKKVTINENDIINDYKSSVISVDSLAKKYHVGKIRIRKILSDNNVERRKRGGQEKGFNFKPDDWKIEKYPKINGKHYIAYSKDGKYYTNDYMNQAGKLTSYIKTLGIEIPTLYDRRKYYMMNGNYWWEQWFDIKLIDDKPVKKCPYCDWETTDIENKSGMFMQHLIKEHKLTIEEYLKKHPEDNDYFQKQAKIIAKNKLLIDDGNYVKCPICGKKMMRMTYWHIKNHGLTITEFKYKFPDFKMESELMEEKDRESQKLSNLAERKTETVSLAEKEISDFLEKNKINIVKNDRKILDGKEIDILIPDYNIGIEYDGLRYHCEGVSNKTSDSHLFKTKKAAEKGINLIHIFEDEYQIHKELVFDKIKQILHLNNNIKIGARKCKIKEINSDAAKDFLNAFHLQGFANSSVYIGAFYNNELIGVMTFKKNGLDKTEQWELNRFATNFKYNCQGLGSKLFKYFINLKNPYTVSSFADRRWTLNPFNNLYINLGFKFSGFTRPSYTYFKLKWGKGEDRYKRFHKMDFRKHILLKKHPELSSDMTEYEMAKTLGYGRIWDCGMLKYVWYSQPPTN